MSELDAIHVAPHNLGSYIVPDEVLGGVCVDVGANVGSFVERYADRFAWLLFYEPNPVTFRICAEKFAGRPNVRGVQRAVSDASDRTLYLMTHENHDSGSVAVSNPTVLNCHEWSLLPVPVVTIALDDILKDVQAWAGVDRIDYLKVDCENSEYELLAHTDLSRIRWIAMELHWQMGRAKNDRLVEHIARSHDTVMTTGGGWMPGGHRDFLFRRRG